jgi:hypothetical protein
MALTHAWYSTSNPKMQWTLFLEYHPTSCEIDDLKFAYFYSQGLLMIASPCDFGAVDIALPLFARIFSERSIPNASTKIQKMFERRELNMLDWQKLQ